MCVAKADVIALNDAFDFSDRVLSALGRSDGRVYEALYHAAKNSALNFDKKWQCYGGQ